MSNKEKENGYGLFDLLANTESFWTRFGLAQIANCPEAIPYLFNTVNTSPREKIKDEDVVDKTKRTIS